MTDYLFYLLLGSAAGAIIAALGIGMVITYQASGVVNFAAGAMAMWSTYVYADLRNGSYPFPIPGLPDRYHFGEDVGYRWALLLALLTSAVLGLLVYVLIFKPLRQAPALAKVVASVGLIIVFITLVAKRFADMSAIRVPKILPREPVTITRDLTVPRDGLWLLFIVVVIAAALWTGSRFLRIGLAIRASAENEKGAVLLGYSPDFLAGLGWVLSSVLTTLLAILAAPQLQLNSTIYTFGFLVPALGAALIGKFQNFGPTVVTGVLIGMGQSLCTKLQNDLSWFPEYGAREGIPFVIIILTMVFLGERLPDRGAVKMWKLPTVPPARVTPVSFLVPTVAAIAGIVLLGPLWRAAIMTTVIAAVLALSLVVLTGFGGQTSLSQMAFAGIAGFALSKLAMRYDIPFPIAPILAALAAMVFGLIVGLPALRVRGTNLAIVTLAGGVTIAEFVFKNPWVIGDISTGGARVPNPSLAGWDLGLVYGTKVSRPIFGIFLVVVLALLGLLVANIRRSGSGRVMLAVRGNERAAAAVGIDVTRVKMLMFAASSFIAGVGGTLIAYRFGSVSDLSYGVIASLTALAVAYLGGITSVSGAVTAGITAQAGIAFYGMSRLFDGLGSWEALIGGVLLIVTAILNPEGIAGGIRLQVAEKRAQKQRAVEQAVEERGAAVAT
ncbi:MAG: ABC transporter permease [Actinomycetota bacterium]|nr:ABC transporter permease [Actinomycetota bacterium]MDA2971896.1 ABC transporter permease [Actinomycetota bacterium]MDA3001186.1 ABC transporter permease [Actinomycetota bacterium]